MPQTIQFELDFRGKRYQDAARGLNALSLSLGQIDHDIFPIVSSELRKLLDGIVEALSRRHSGAWPGGTTEKSLSRRSGALIQSLKDNSRVTGGNIEDLVASFGAISYARIQEFGGTITPKKAKFLTVPLPAALNSDGTPIKQKARDWANTFVITSKAGNLLIVRKQGRQIIPLYVLRSSVYIPPRLNLRTSVAAALPAWVDELGAKMVQALLKDVKG